MCHADSLAAHLEHVYGRLGDLLGRLQAMAPASGVAPPPGGGWHHLVPAGGLEQELAAALSLLDAARPRIPPERWPGYHALREEVERAHRWDGLPQALMHPDPVPANAIVAGGGSLVLVDWAGAGRGPRIAPLGFLLWAAGSRGRGCVEAACTKYRAHVRLEREELERLEAAVAARALILAVWSVAVGRQRVSEVAEALPATRAQAAATAAVARAAL